MRTTVRIDDELLRQLKLQAAREGRSVSDLIEDAVRQALSRRDRASDEVPPLPVFGGSGVMPGIDLVSSAALRDAMDEGESLDALR